MGKTFSKTFFIFLGGLLLLNLLQAYFTPLIYDEAYYWHYAQNLDWGYFDHPPMVALLVKLSGLLFGGEIGVRLMGCLMGVATLMVIWSLIEDKEKEKQVPLFFLLAFAMVLFNAYGFFTLPDTPLLFFTALFLWVYKRFLTKASLITAIALGLCMAALLYSKYHAVLIIVFILLSNLKLLANKYAWLAVIVALLAYTPHFLWLYEHNFVSVKYHLFERPNHPYNFGEFTLGHFLNCIVNFGLLFPWFYWALFKTKPKDLFKRGLLFLSYGVIAFFFVSSFHRRAQAQWVIVICVPMLIIAYHYLLHHMWAKKWLWRIGLFSGLLILFARIWLVHQPLLPFMHYETHGAKTWVKKLNDIVGDTPVVFENSYRRAPMYSFYSGNTAFSLNNIHYRQNQYSIDSSEAKIQGKKIAYVTKFTNKGDFSYQPLWDKKYYGRYMDNFQSFRKLQILVAEQPVDVKTGQQTLKIYNPYTTDIPLKNISASVAYLNDYKRIIEIKGFKLKPTVTGNQIVKAKDTTWFNFSYPKEEKGGAKFVKFSLSENGLHGAINSPSIAIKP